MLSSILILSQFLPLKFFYHVSLLFVIYITLASKSLSLDKNPIVLVAVETQNK